MKLITLYIPEAYLEALDRLIDNRYYPNRAEAMRLAIRDLVQTEMPVVVYVDSVFSTEDAEVIEDLAKKREDGAVEL